MDRFQLTLRLATPLVTGGGYMTLDALLAAILFDQGLTVEQAHNQIPLRNTDGLWHGSAAIYESVEVGRQAFVANLRANHDLDPSLLARNKKGAIHTKISLKRQREFGAVMNGYRYVTTSSVAWYGEGNVKGVRRLIETVSFIGKRRANGFGEIQSFEIEESDSDGVVGLTGEPLRPVPIEMFSGDDSSIRADVAWRPAYWHPENRAFCFVPAPNT